MTICMVWREEAESQREYRFVSVPKVGEVVTLPDEPHAREVIRVVHFPRHLDARDEPHIMLRLKLVETSAPPVGGRTSD